ncbi:MULTISPECIES: EamA family transporter [Desulfovibrio]|jgi:multidrug transporter EmrE-like cation transporter|uniref:EamA family transporter n=1 Tax=Desulfovibrio TaxID=872 RepID=UPI00041D743B|nr:MULTISPECIES: EamA family transporter [Desulfovibrio]HMM39981.1 EamA family transporter [Desulfovibrio sp.]
MKYFLLAATVLLISFGQILLKLGAEGLKGGAGCVLNLFGLNLTWHLLVGVFVYGAATITWILTLKEMPLSIAYPAVSLSYVLVALLSIGMLGERVNLTYGLGLVCIMVGVSLIAFR